MNRPAEAPVVQAHDMSREVKLTANEARPTARELHVEPTPSGRWTVCYEHGKRALSDHLTANEAQDFAKQRARTESIAGTVLHDAYQHVHEVPHSHPEHSGVGYSVTVVRRVARRTSPWAGRRAPRLLRRTCRDARMQQAKLLSGAYGADPNRVSRYVQ